MNGRDGTSLFAALEEQLGLKLEPQRAPAEVLVIESAERPVEDLEPTLVVPCPIPDRPDPSRDDGVQRVEPSQGSTVIT